MRTSCFDETLISYGYSESYSSSRESEIKFVNEVRPILSEDAN